MMASSPSSADSNPFRLFGNATGNAPNSICGGGYGLDKNIAEFFEELFVERLSENDR